MRRRDFLAAGAMLGCAGVWERRLAAAETDPVRFPPPAPLPFKDERSDLKITAIRPVTLEPLRPPPKYQAAAGAWNTTDVEIANPLSIYPRFKPRRSLFYADDLGPLTVAVETNKGITGYGYGGPGTSYIAEKHLGKLLVGEDPFAVERLWDIMWRGTLYYGRK